MNKKVKETITLIVELAIILIIAYFLFTFIQGVFTTSFETGKKLAVSTEGETIERNITINEDETIVDFATDLENNDIIASKYSFIATSYINGNTADLIPGTYLLNSSMDADEIYDTINPNEE